MVDGETAVVDSANWNNASLRENREVVVAIHGDDVGTYYAEVFYDDWGDEDAWPLPISLLGAIALALVVAVGAVRQYVPFGAPEGREIDSRTDGEDDPGPGVGPPEPAGSDWSEKSPAWDGPGGERSG